MRDVDEYEQGPRASTRACTFGAMPRSFTGLVSLVPPPRPASRVTAPRQPAGNPRSVHEQCR